MQVLLENNIPIPKDGRARTGLMAVMRGMEVGQSFAIPLDGNDSRQANKIRAAASNCAATDKQGRKWIVHKYEENGVMVFRVWRTQ